METVKAQLRCPGRTEEIANAVFISLAAIALAQLYIRQGVRERGRAWRGTSTHITCMAGQQEPQSICEKLYMVYVILLGLWPSIAAHIEKVNIEWRRLVNFVNAGGGDLLWTLHRAEWLYATAPLVVVLSLWPRTLCKYISYCRQLLQRPENMVTLSRLCWREPSSTYMHMT